MHKYLVIVESPAKERTISKILGDDFVVKSSYGHIRDLPNNKLGVEIEKNYQPKYVLISKAKKIIPQLKEYTQKSKKVYIATDYDREGEAIAWHLKEALSLPEGKIERITFHEITSEAIKESLKNPRKIDINLVNSQQARRVLDRLVGYKLSPLLWRKVKRGLSAGRVQSVAVKLICDREKEIEDFKSQEYWSLQAELKKTDKEGAFLSKLYSKNDNKLDKLDLKSKEDTDSIINELQNVTFKVKDILSKSQKKSPLPPYTTSTLQQDASRRLYFSAAKTMMIAQKLYEGISLKKEGTVGLITYMRTDSLNIAESARKEAKKYIGDEFGPKYLPAKPKIYKTKIKGAQEAHEAIRPTSVLRSPENIKKNLSGDEYKLYNLIWCRFLSSQMSDALYDTKRVDIQANDYIFRASGRVLKFKGFLEVYTIEDENNNKDNNEKKQNDSYLPDLTVGEQLQLLRFLPEQHFTEPPPRYNEASLIKALEENGIGRPSTYAPIIKTIQSRNYVHLESRHFLPTQLGSIVNDVLKNHFSEIVDLKFTATIEEKLDEIAEGKDKWTEVVNEFYNPFKVDLEKAEKNIVRQKIKPQETKEICPKCGKIMVLRESRRGRFIACSGFPNCRTTFSVDKDNNKIVRPKPQMTSLKCEKCGKPMLKRVGRRGPFLACSGFPKCRNTKKWQDSYNSELKDE
ncbi:MAG: type I DNA topoisomerase [Endomicrobiales bacterium]|nr:type I DNA topoisomerase [Endomicrobiales bacterium]